MQAGAWTGEADCVFAPPAGEHEIQTVKNYRFYVSAPIGCTRLCAGETKPGVAPPRPVTAKVIEPDDLAEFFQKEGLVLHTLHNRPHPGFQKLRTTVQAEGSAEGGNGRSFIVMDELGMDLNSYVRAERGLPEDEVQVLFRQLVSAVAHCHANQIVLRDMKLGKIFFSTTQPSQLVFADLDGAEVLSGGKVGQLRDQKGSPAYVCPEVLCCKPYGGYAADMWSLGVVLYRMLTGIYPFHDSEPARLFDKILLGSSAIHFPATVSSSARNVIRRLLERNPKSRPSAKSLLEDQWLQHGHDEGMATLRRRWCFASRTSTSALFPSASSASSPAGTDTGAAGGQGGGGNEAPSSRGGAAGVCNGGGRVGSSEARDDRELSSNRRPSESLLRRRGSTSSLGSDDGNERDVGDDEDEQLVPDFDDNEDSKQAITPTRSKSFNFGGSSASRAKLKAAARKKRLTAKVVSAFDKEQRAAATADAAAAAATAAAAAKKRRSVTLVGGRSCRRRVSQKGFVLPPGLVGWDNGQALQMPPTTAERHVATA